MADVFSVPIVDHTEVKRMLDELEAGPRGLGGKDERELRKRMVEQLIIDESEHEAVEQEHPGERSRSPRAAPPGGLPR